MSTPRTLRNDCANSVKSFPVSVGVKMIAGKWHTVSCMRGVSDIPTSPGVYVIFFGREAVYVGQSNNLRLRVLSHNIRYGYAQNIKTPWGDLPGDTGVSARIKIS